MSAAVAAAAAAAALKQRQYNSLSSQHNSGASSENVYGYDYGYGYNAFTNPMVFRGAPMQQPLATSRYESQKQRDWVAFGEYLHDHHTSLALSRCSGTHVLEFLKYVDQFGKTKVHSEACPLFGQPSPPAACPCPLQQAWGSLDALVRRLRVAFEENGGRPETNPFGASAVRLYLRDVRDAQAKARGIEYD